MLLLPKYCSKLSSIYKLRCKFNTLKSYSCLTDQKMTSQWSDPKEIRIPVSYGFIAAKVWGNETAEPVLALHGWQDNAGTFDRLIPLLSSNLYIVAVDGPGHGLSSHKPVGAFYHYMEMLVDIQHVIDYLKWERFSIIGHSLGGTVGLLYSSVYPERVKNLILLDIIKPPSREAHLLPSTTREGIESLLKIEKKTYDTTPVYSMEEAQSRLIAGLLNQVTEEGASVLLKRGCRPSECGTGVVFSRDIRVKMIGDIQKLSHGDLRAFMSEVCCNLLIIVGRESVVVQSQSPELIVEFMEIYDKNCETFKIIEVGGNHFVHLNNPERVAPHIDTFFKQFIKAKM